MYYFSYLTYATQIAIIDYKLDSLSLLPNT